MKRLEDSALVKILQNQEKMEDYLLDLKDKPSSIDPMIWQVHLSAPTKNRMPVLEKFFRDLLKKYSMVFNFLPDHLVLAKVYKILNIPFNVSSSKTSTVDVVTCKKPNIARSNRYLKLYNSWRKNESNSDLGIYEYNEERPGPFVSYTEFRKECKKKKPYHISAADVLSQLSKSKVKEKLVSNFAFDSQFLTKDYGQQTNSRISAGDVNQYARKQTKTRPKPKSPEFGLPKRQTLPKENRFTIFKSKCPPRLNVELKSKRSDSASSAHPTTGDEHVGSGHLFKVPYSRQFSSLATSSKSKDDTVLASRTNIDNASASSGSLLKIPNPPKSTFSLSTFSENQDETVLANRMDVENCSLPEKIQIEADTVIVEEQVVELNLNTGESTLINSNEFCEEDPHQLSSEESVSVILRTPVDENISTSNSSEPEVVYSSNRSDDDVVSIECNTRQPDLPSVTPRQLVLVDEERNSEAFTDQPNEANFIYSPVSKNSSQSHSSCEHLGSEQSKETSEVKVIGDFDQLYQRTPLKIERKKSLMSVKKAQYSESSSAFDRLLEEYENNHLGFETSQADVEEEKNKVSDSETSIVSSKASPSLVRSVIYTQRSSESESEDIDFTFYSVHSPIISQRDEPVDYIPGQPASDMVYVSPEKPSSQSRDSTSQQSATKVVSPAKGMPHSQSSATPERLVSEIVVTSPEKRHSPSRNSTPEHPVSKIILASQKKHFSPSMKVSPKQPIPKIMSASCEKLHSPSNSSTPGQPASKIVPAGPENPCPPMENTVFESPTQKFASTTDGKSRSQSKNSTPVQPVLEIVAASQEASRSQEKKPTKKKITALRSSKTAKASKAKTDKQVRKLTDFVEFSVRKRQVSNFEFDESVDQMVGLRKKESPTPYESTQTSSFEWSPKSQHSAGSRKIRKVKKLFNESEDYLSPSPVKERPSAKVESPAIRICESPSFSRNDDHLEVEKISDSDSSPKLHSATCYESGEVEKLLIENENSLLPSPTQEKNFEVDSDRSMCESVLFSKHSDLQEIEKSSDSDSSSITLSKEFKTLSLASRKSYILFSSESSETSPSSTRTVNIPNSQTATMLNSQFSTEITLDQVDKMMEGVIPNDSTDSSFRFSLPSQFEFKDSPKSDSNLSDIMPSSSSALGKTLIAAEFLDEYPVPSSDEEAVPCRQSSNFASLDSTYPASRSTFKENFSASIYSLEDAPNEDMEDEFSDRNIFNSSFSIRDSSITQKKSKKLLSSNVNSGLSSRRHCLSLPIENKSSGQKKKLKKTRVDVFDFDNTSDEDVFRDRSFRSLPTQLKKKSTSQSSQQVRRRHFLGKENEIKEKKSQQKFKNDVRDFSKSSPSVAEKSRQFSYSEKKKAPVLSQKSTQFVIISDDDYESDELNTALNDSLTKFNNWKEVNQDVSESDAESTTSHHFDADIAQLLTEYAAMNAEQQSLSVSSNKSNSESTTFMSTLSVKSNSPNLNPKIRTPRRKPVTSGSSNYKDVMWNSYPDSLETALTTPEEKLEEVRNTLREKVINANSQKLFSSQKSKSSRENESDSFGFLDWE